eukprot:TRINITY_DN38447_c0_g1_i1.p1 TRINITY_DN38447_c0_g1~~TRINITY_DN38447_c0_g1_i1.p1  ORF type:complete len:290 (+),score=43.25 TRINITY_DN38447_c0_g1_i1:34-870(+)
MASIINRDLLTYTLETYKARSGWGAEVSKDLCTGERTVTGEGFIVSSKGVVHGTDSAKFKDGHIYRSATVIDAKSVVVHTTDVVDGVGEEEDINTEFLTEYVLNETGGFYERPVDSGSLLVIGLDPNNRMAVLGFDVDVALCTFSRVGGPESELQLTHYKHFEGLKLIVTTRPSDTTTFFSLPTQRYIVVLEKSSFTVFARATPSSPIGNQASFTLPEQPLHALPIESPEGCLVTITTPTAKYTYSFTPPTEPQLPDNGMDAEQMARINAVLASGGEW